jgi:hypothetical protein
VTVIVPDEDPLPPPPDLQELVKRFNGYDKITPEAWAKYDRQLAATHEWLAAHHKVQRKRKA